MENLNFYEPPVGGRVNSPKLRGAAQFIREFEGLPQGVTRFDLLKLVKHAGPFAGFSSKMIQLLEYYILFTRDCDWVANGQPIVYQALSKTALTHEQSKDSPLDRQLYCKNNCPMKKVTYSFVIHNPTVQKMSYTQLFGRRIRVV